MSGFRIDIRENTKKQAAAELELNDCYIAFISRPLAEANAGKWSDPVCLRFVPSEGNPGIVEIECRTVAHE